MCFVINKPDGFYVERPCLPKLIAFVSQVLLSFSSTESLVLINVSLSAIFLRHTLQG